MSIERFPRPYAVGSTVRVGWQLGKVIFRIGLYHLVWWPDSFSMMAK